MAEVDLRALLKKLVLQNGVQCEGLNPDETALLRELENELTTELREAKPIEALK